MKTNLTLIGMPGAGKSTIGIILAKNLSLGFIDTDVLIQINQQKSLQQILDESDHLNLRAIEEDEILKLNVSRHVIATGGSAAYSDKAMVHLQRRYPPSSSLKSPLSRSNGAFATLPPGASPRPRIRLSTNSSTNGKFCTGNMPSLTIHCDGLDQEDVADEIAGRVRHQGR